jgi:hypothetical protein
MRQRGIFGRDAGNRKQDRQQQNPVAHVRLLG